MTIELQKLIKDASAQLGSDACAEGRHQWESEGSRGCPNDWTDKCGQAVYRCTVCGVHDYGEPHGPGARDCEEYCLGAHWYASFDDIVEGKAP